jgi:hypothetical protein
MEMFDKLFAVLTCAMVHGLDRYFIPSKASQQNVCNVFNSSNGKIY